MHEAFVHAYWHSHHWVLVPKDVVENNLQSWMHKSILLLKDLTPSSEDAIDSCTQLFPTPQTSSCANKTAFYRLSLRNPNVHFPPPDAWAAPGHHVPFLRTEEGEGEGSWRAGAKSSARTRAETSSSCCVRGMQSKRLCSESSSGEEQQIWNIRKQAHAYEGHVWYLSINYKLFHSQAAFFQANHLLQSYWLSRKDLILYGQTDITNFILFYKKVIIIAEADLFWKDSISHFFPTYSYFLFSA